MSKKKSIIEPPKDQDHLEVYPEKKQVSAFPERRFIKMNRVLVIFTLINLACILAGASIFIYTARRVDVKVQNKQGLLIYQIDREEKKLKQAEYRERKMPAKRFIMESFLKQYITEYHSFSDTLANANERFSENGLVLKASMTTIKDKIRKDLDALRRETLDVYRTRDVHIYNLHPYHGNLWTAVIETFDFPKSDGPPVCNGCSDNSTKCLKCKYEKAIQRQRRRIWIRVSFNPQNSWVRKEEADYLRTSQDNPFGIVIEGYYIGYMPKDATNLNWDLPPELS